MFALAPLFLLFVAQGVFALESIQGKYKVNLEVNYETLCPDSIKFFRNQLKPLMESSVGKHVNLSLVAWGKSQASEGPRWFYKFKCQHGAKECDGNRDHACSYNIWRKPVHQDFALCTMTLKDHYPPSNSEACAKQLKLPFHDIEKCRHNNRGDFFLAEFGNRTKEYKPKLNYVPWLVFNSVYNRKKMISGLSDLRSVVCDYIGKEICDENKKKKYHKLSTH